MNSWSMFSMLPFIGSAVVKQSVPAVARHQPTNTQEDCLGAWPTSPLYSSVWDKQWKNRRGCLDIPLGNPKSVRTKWDWRWRTADMEEKRGEIILRPSWFALDWSGDAPEADKELEPVESPLKWTAIKKHLHPSCKTSRDAEQFSAERDRLFPTEVNRVFKAHKNDFATTKENEEDIVKSKQKVRNWKCVKCQGNFRVRGSTVVTC